MEMEDKFVVKDLSTEELEKEIARLKSLPIQREIKRNVKRKKKELTQGEMENILSGAIGLNEEEIMKCKLQKALGWPKGGEG
jgi:hypothetical protein